MWGYGTVWRRGMVLLRHGLLAIIDDISLGPAQQASGKEYIAGPVFAMSSGSGAEPHKLPLATHAANTSQSSYWDLREFANNDSLLVLMAGAELANSTSCNIMAGASSCRPDLGTCNRSATGRGGAPMCPHTSIFGYSSASGAGRSTIVTLMVPHRLGAKALTAAKVGELQVDIDGTNVVVDLGSWGKTQGEAPAPRRVTFDLSCGQWVVT